MPAVDLKLFLSPKQTLLDKVRITLYIRHYRLIIEKTCDHWIWKFIFLQACPEKRTG
jgi:hypothetical protein